VRTAPPVRLCGGGGRLCQSDATADSAVGARRMPPWSTGRSGRSCEARSIAETADPCQHA